MTYLRQVRHRELIELTESTQSINSLNPITQLSQLRSQLPTHLLQYRRRLATLEEVGRQEALPEALQEAAHVR